MTGCAWTVHPARDRPAAAVLASGILIAAGAATGLTISSVIAAPAAVAILTLTLRHFFFPTRYTVDEHGVSVRCLGIETRRAWARLRRFRYDDAGAFLSTRARPSLLDSFTGLHLTWAGNKDEVVSAIERHTLAHQR